MPSINTEVKTAIRRSGWKTCSVCISKKTITISTALGGYIGNRVDVCEAGGVLAFVNNPDGKYRTAPVAPNSSRRQINSRPLARYIAEKFGAYDRHTLFAWTDGKNVLFSNGLAGGNVHVHEGFKKIPDPQKRRYENSVRIVSDRFYVSSMFQSKMTGQLSLYECGDLFVLVSDSEGDLIALDRNKFGTKTIHAPRLVRYVIEKTATHNLFGTEIADGLVFSKDPEYTYGSIDMTLARRLKEKWI